MELFLSILPRFGFWDASDPSTTDDADEERWGLKELAPGTEPQLDLIAIHGLNGHRERTWTADNNVLWLRDLLPAEIPRARILTYGYDSRTHGTWEEDISRQTLNGHGIKLLQALSLKREKTKTTCRPIIFIAHSLGGIVLKSALIHATLTSPAHNEKHHAVKLSTYGIVFLGTPHQGANGVSLARMAARIVSVYGKTNDNALKHLEQHSEWLNDQLEQYKAISSDFDTKFCFEGTETLIMGRYKVLVVPPWSATVPGATNVDLIEIRKNHRNMVRFRSARDDDFTTIADHLSIMAEKAVDKIASAWSSLSAPTQKFANQIVHELGYLPLAVDHAGAYIFSQCLSLKEYPAAFNDNVKRVLSKQSRTYGFQDRHDPVFKTFETSFVKIENLDPVAAKILVLCSFYDNGDVPTDIFSSLANDQGNESLETTRTKLGLAKLHRLLDQNDEAETMYDDCIRVFTRERGSIALETTQALTGSGIVRWRQSRLSEARSLLESGIRGYKARLGSAHPETLVATEALGLVYKELAEYDEATQLIQEALENNTSNLGPEHPATVRNMQNLALCLIKLDRLDEAARLQQRVLEIGERQLGPLHPNVLRALHNMAYIHFLQGDHADAQPLCELAITGREKILGKDSLETYGSVELLGVIYFRRGELEEAQTILRRAIKGFRSQSSGAASGVLQMFRALDWLAQVCEARGDVEQAKLCYEEALEGHFQALGRKHPTTKKNLRSLQELLEKVGEVGEAEMVGRRFGDV
ncbi:hypothetical protein L207DRAFT_627774 [Neofusicoccum parvum]|uniref:Uncharacterized protein n=1 Tax=Neofusicoccum parvum TaxID=310453 RepID=A0ACB5RR83_9PEZI|nr:hypothetical protein L207DRAFT_627774 [Neofusicoccum parvum]